MIILATDPFRTKPLYYGFDGDGKFGAATYKSCLTELGFSGTTYAEPNTTYIFDMDDTSSGYVTKTTNVEWDLEQHLTSWDAWNDAFLKAIEKRTKDVREQIFIGMSSGYDSGAIACELNRQKVPHQIYTVNGSENQSVLKRRFDLLNRANIHVSDPGMLERDLCDRHINEHVEEFMYTIHSSSSDYNEYNLRLQDDNGSRNLSYICWLAKEDCKKIYLSGMGSDEIYSDYGFKGVKKYPHSNFGGLFPDDLSSIFPWASFYGSSMESYIAKEEYVAGSYGIETRYPYLDRYLVQYFLWMTPEAKNEFYKAPLHQYLTKHDFPFCVEEKIGF